MAGDVAGDGKLPGLFFGLYMSRHRRFHLDIEMIDFTHDLFLHDNVLLFHKRAPVELAAMCGTSEASIATRPVK